VYLAQLTKNQPTINLYFKYFSYVVVGRVVLDYFYCLLNPIPNRGEGDFQEVLNNAHDCLSFSMSITAILKIIRVS
jgi:hypothetical protein